MTIIINLPFPKSWTVDGPQMTVNPGQVNIRYDYVPDEGKRHWVTVRFTGVIAYRYMDESCFTESLDIVTEGMIQFGPDSSLWLREVKERREQFFVKNSAMYEMYGQFDFYHFGLWFGEDGCFEVVARAYEIEVDEIS